jgi:hypothetical protein
MPIATLNQEGKININGIIIDALYAPMFRICLISGGQLDCLGYDSDFGHSHCIIDRDSTKYITGHISENNFYTFTPEVTCNIYITTRSGKSIDASKPQQFPSTLPLQQHTSATLSPTITQQTEALLELSAETHSRSVSLQGNLV